MIAEEIEKYSVILKAGERKTLEDERSEAHARLYIKAADTIRLVKIDHAVIPEQMCNVRKSDFLVLGENSKTTHVIELKGTLIEEAFSQLLGTVVILEEDADTEELVKNRTVLDAYIVSPDRQRIPAVHSQAEKKLARRLAAGIQGKCNDMYELIHFVKVVSKQKQLSVKGRQIISSNDAPLKLG